MHWLSAGLSAAAVMVLTAWTQPAHATTPGFDCDTAKAEVEKMICGDDSLAEMDFRLASDFARVLARASADQVSSLKAAQRAWRAAMLRCAKAGDPRACVVDAYTKRFADF